MKATQNAMMGVVAFLLTVYFVYRVERQPGATVSLGVLWTRFPKFILGFIAASAIATWFINGSGVENAADIVRVAGTDLRTIFFILAFVCIGLEFRVTSLREAGVKPVLVFAAATVLNLVLAFALASILFAGFTLDDGRREGASVEADQQHRVAELPVVARPEAGGVVHDRDVHAARPERRVR